MSRKQFNDAGLKLKQNGWTHTLTAMSSAGERHGNYGSLYTKGNQRFWLNKDTFNNLPA